MANMAFTISFYNMHGFSEEKLHAELCLVRDEILRSDNLSFKDMRAQAVYH